MSKTVVLAEKPSVGRDIAKVLNCGKKGMALKATSISSLGHWVIWLPMQIRNLMMKNIKRGALRTCPCCRLLWNWSWSSNQANSFNLLKHNWIAMMSRMSSLQRMWIYLYEIQLYINPILLKLLLHQGYPYK